MIDEHGAMCTRVRLAGKLSESIWVAWCCFFSMPALLFIVCFLIELCDYPVFRIGLHSVRCAEPLQLNCSVRKQENRLRKWIASPWIIFNIIDGIKWWKTFVISWFCDCVLTHFKGGHRNSLSEFRWHFRCVLWWCGTLKLELYTITWHLKCAFEWDEVNGGLKRVWQFDFPFHFICFYV